MPSKIAVRQCGTPCIGKREWSTCWLVLKGVLHASGSGSVARRYELNTLKMGRGLFLRQVADSSDDADENNSDAAD